MALGLPALILNGALLGGLLGMGRIGALSLGVRRDRSQSCRWLRRPPPGWVYGLTGALALVSLATYVMAAILWWFCRGQAHLPWSAPRGAPGDVVRSLYRSNSAIGVLMALTTIDVVLARYVLAPVDSGEYALISTLGRSPIWVTQFLALALIPTLATSGSRRSILRAGGLVLGVCLLGTAVAAMAPEALDRPARRVCLPRC